MKTSKETQIKKNDINRDILKNACYFYKIECIQNDHNCGFISNYEMIKQIKNITNETFKQLIKTN